MLYAIASCKASACTSARINNYWNIPAHTPTAHAHIPARTHARTANAHEHPPRKHKQTQTQMRVGTRHKSPTYVQFHTHTKQYCYWKPCSMSYIQAWYDIVDFVSCTSGHTQTYLLLAPPTSRCGGAMVLPSERHTRVHAHRTHTAHCTPHAHMY